MIRITVRRLPGDIQGPDIIDPLLCSVPAAMARGRSEINRSCGDREMITLSCPGMVYADPGDLVLVVEGAASYRAMVRDIEQRLARSADGSPECETVLTCEALA